MVHSSPLTIASRWKDVNERPGGFDYLRLGLAVSVLLWHSYSLTYGDAIASDLWASPAGLALEAILPMFFALSGFLVYGSLERSPNLLAFLLQRAVRIYPALCVEVFVAALVLGPCVTTLNLTEYFRSPGFWQYFLNALGYIHFILPGVFEHNPFSFVNPSLWTVPSELECYILICNFAIMGYTRSRSVAIGLFITVTAAVWCLLKMTGESGTPLNGVHSHILMLSFLAGTLLYRFKDLVPYRGSIALLAVVAAVLALRFDLTVVFSPLPVAYLTVYLGLRNPKQNSVMRSGDYSYGTYLYAAPIQQTVVLLLGSFHSWAVNVALSLPATLLVAVVSWHCVERPSLKLKKILARRWPALTLPAPATLRPSLSALKAESTQVPKNEVLYQALVIRGSR